jgi:hypothetical protein
VQIFDESHGKEQKLDAEVGGANHDLEGDFGDDGGLPDEPADAEAADDDDRASTCSNNSDLPSEPEDDGSGNDIDDNSSADDAKARMADEDDDESSSKVAQALASDLFPGSPHTVKLAMDLLLLHQRRHKTTDQSMIGICDLLKLLLPEGNNMLRFQTMKDWLNRRTLEDVQNFNVCVNDCVVFRNAPAEFDAGRKRQHAAATHCPTCGEARLDSVGKPRKVIARIDRILNSFDSLQIFRYLPIIKQLQALLLRRDLAGRLTLNLNPRTDGVMHDVQDGAGWREQILQDAEFCSEPRNLALSFSTDGVQLFKHSQRTMWPLLLEVRASVRKPCAYNLVDRFPAREFAARTAQQARKHRARWRCSRPEQTEIADRVHRHRCRRHAGAVARRSGSGQRWRQLQPARQIAVHSRRLSCAVARHAAAGRWH